VVAPKHANSRLKPKAQALDSVLNKLPVRGELGQHLQKRNSLVNIPAAFLKLNKTIDFFE
jgi:hypothetical protein